MADAQLLEARAYMIGLDLAIDLAEEGKGVECHSAWHQ
jgi:hypothetical protein